MAAHRAARSTTGTTALQKAAGVVAAVFLLVGVLGFVPGITTDYDRLALWGPQSHAHLLGIFQVSVLHNVVHLLFGLMGLAAARSAPGARGFLVGGGLVYAVLWAYGVLVDQGSQANFVPLDHADNWLHLALAVAMIGLGLALSRSDRPVAATRR
jgi:hypothetical protein